MGLPHVGGPTAAGAHEIEALQQEIQRLRALVSRDLGMLERERIFAERLARLHAFTASLTEAATTDEIARALADHGRAALGARAVAIWLRAADGSGRLAHHAGCSEGAVGALEVVAADETTPVGAALVHGKSSWMTSRALVAARWNRAAREGWFGDEVALATVPLETRSGRHGAMAVSFPGSRHVATEDRAMLVAIARQGSQALERARLLDAERRARADAEAEHQRTAFLYEASALLASSLDWEDTLASVARLAVPRVADCCAVDLVEDVEQRRASVVVAHADPEKAGMARELGRRYPTDPASVQGIGRVLRTGEPELYPDVTDALLVSVAQDDEHLRICREMGLRSIMIVPMAARGRILGVITFMSAESQRRYGPSDLAMAGSLARRCALAMDNARLYAEAQRAIRARDDVLAIVSHDLRNPLHAIGMASNLLQRASSPERTRQHAAAIERSAHRAGRLIRDLLDLSTLESGRVMLDRAPVDAATLLSEAAALIQPIAAERSISVEVASGPDEPSDAWCDRERIIQVFSNLLGNAVTFTPPGGRVTLSAIPAAGEVRFSVTDTGPGVPLEHQAHIFDRYWKSRESRQGAGLGLSIARSIVDAHGGRIWVESEPGAGATFLFTIPQPARSPAQ
ncbi:MAG TPA: GAF domain-containing sensor histidine kinase [Anaeromyxobacteraceae bacterium]|nr:GAF domain-containing sensor histidine kinase [Anaeromyxobacteraceae bacterium]